MNCNKKTSKKNTRNSCRNSRTNSCINSRTNSRLISHNLPAMSLSCRIMIVHAVPVMSMFCKILNWRSHEYLLKQATHQHEQHDHTHIYKHCACWCCHLAEPMTIQNIEKWNRWCCRLAHEDTLTMKHTQLDAFNPTHAHTCQIKQPKQVRKTPTWLPATSYNMPPSFKALQKHCCSVLEPMFVSCCLY